MILSSERLILREFEESDFKFIHPYCSDPETIQFMDWGPNSVEDTKKFLSDCKNEQNKTPRLQYVFGIVLKSSGLLVGTIGIEIQSLVDRDASFGYILTKDSWGLGIATEAARRIVEFGFQDLNLHRLWATCRPENEKSMCVLQKLGFEREGLLRQNKFIRGSFHDSVLYAKLSHS